MKRSDQIFLLVEECCSLTDKLVKLSETPGGSLREKVDLESAVLSFERAREELWDALSQALREERKVGRGDFADLSAENEAIVAEGVFMQRSDFGRDGFGIPYEGFGSDPGSPHPLD